MFQNAFGDCRFETKWKIYLRKSVPPGHYPKERFFIKTRKRDLFILYRPYGETVGVVGAVA